MNLHLLVMYAGDYDGYYLGGSTYNSSRGGDFNYGYLGFLINAGYVSGEDKRSVSPWTWLVSRNWVCPKVPGTMLSQGKVKAWSAYGLPIDFPAANDLPVWSGIDFFKTGDPRLSAPSRIVYLSDSWGAGYPRANFYTQIVSTWAVTLNHSGRASVGFLDGHANHFTGDTVKEEYQCKSVVVSGL